MPRSEQHQKASKLLVDMKRHFDGGRFEEAYGSAYEAYDIGKELRNDKTTVEESINILQSLIKELEQRNDERFLNLLQRAHFQEGMSHMHHQEITKASSAAIRRQKRSLNSFKKAIDLGFNDPAVWSNYGALLGSSEPIEGRDKGIEAIDKAIELSPTNTGLYFAKISTLNRIPSRDWKVEHGQLALETLTQLLRIDHEYPELESLTEETIAKIRKEWKKDPGQVLLKTVEWHSLMKSKKNPFSSKDE